tara:strand:+ start:413 stop:637 length:225 start_codon:yes stop_codon:yes gene_type:complete
MNFKLQKTLNKSKEMRTDEYTAHLEAQLLIADKDSPAMKALNEIASTIALPIYNADMLDRIEDLVIGVTGGTDD